MRTAASVRADCGVAPRATITSAFQPAIVCMIGPKCQRFSLYASNLHNLRGLVIVRLRPPALYHFSFAPPFILWGIFVQDTNVTERVRWALRMRRTVVWLTRSADEGSSTNIEEIACSGYRRSYAKQLTSSC